MADWIGYQWLADEFGIEPVQPFPTRSHIGNSRATSTRDGFAIETYTEATWPGPSATDHLSFALKREGVHLEFLARLFEILPADVMAEWINRTPSGKYARRACFLYEWLTRKQINFPGVKIGNYVDALPAGYLGAMRLTNVPRWRVRNNLPGTRDYCPLVRRTPRVREIEAYDCRAKLEQLDSEFGTDTLMRSSAWLTIKESRASFQIEHEESKRDRITRFAVVMEEYCGKAVDPLSDEFLAQLQAEILGPRALRFGPRKSPVFVGQSGITREIVNYVAPHWDQIEPLLNGLAHFLV